MESRHGNLLLSAASGDNSSKRTALLLLLDDVSQGRDIYADIPTILPIVLSKSSSNEVRSLGYYLLRTQNSLSLSLWIPALKTVLTRDLQSPDASLRGSAQRLLIASDSHNRQQSSTYEDKKDYSPEELLSLAGIVPSLGTAGLSVVCQLVPYLEKLKAHRRALSAVCGALRSGLRSTKDPSQRLSGLRSVLRPLVSISLDVAIGRVLNPSGTMSRKLDVLSFVDSVSSKSEGDVDMRLDELCVLCDETMIIRRREMSRIEEDAWSEMATEVIMLGIHSLEELVGMIHSKFYRTLFVVVRLLSCLCGDVYHGETYTVEYRDKSVSDLSDLLIRRKSVQFALSALHEVWEKWRFPANVRGKVVYLISGALLYGYMDHSQNKTSEMTIFSLLESGIKDLYCEDRTHDIGNIVSLQLLEAVVGAVFVSASKSTDSSLLDMVKNMVKNLRDNVRNNMFSVFLEKWDSVLDSVDDEKDSLEMYVTTIPPLREDHSVFLCFENLLSIPKETICSTSVDDQKEDVPFPFHIPKRTNSQRISDELMKILTSGSDPVQLEGRIVVNAEQKEVLLEVMLTNCTGKDLKDITLSIYPPTNVFVNFDVSVNGPDNTHVSVHSLSTGAVHSVSRKFIISEDVDEGHCSFSFMIEFGDDIFSTILTSELEVRGYDMLKKFHGIPSVGGNMASKKFRTVHENMTCKDILRALQNYSTIKEVAVKERDDGKNIHGLYCCHTWREDSIYMIFSAVEVDKRSFVMWELNGVNLSFISLLCQQFSQWLSVMGLTPSHVEKIGIRNIEVGTAELSTQKVHSEDIYEDSSSVDDLLKRFSNISQKNSSKVEK